MNEQQELNYQRIARVIEYIRANFKEQPDVEELAALVHLSPFHFHRMFTEWAGTTPKRFLQYTSLQYAKALLRDKSLSLFDAAYETGLSGTSRLHDMFINIERMTPATFRDGGKGLDISYSFVDTLFGQVLIAATPNGVCHMSFEEDTAQGLSNLMKRFPAAHFSMQQTDEQRQALLYLSNDWDSITKIKLHLRATDFQLKVWEALLKIPIGRLSTYAAVAAAIGIPAASRAVGTAIGSNPVALLIPCHRVIQSGGGLGGYMWGTTRKSAIIGWEAAATQSNIAAE